MMLKTLGRLARTYAVFAVPVLVLAVAAGYVTTSVLHPAQHARHLASIVTQYEATAEVTAALRKERALTIVAARATSEAARADAVAELGAARKHTQTAFATAANSATTDSSAPIETAQVSAIVRGAHNDITALRKRIDGGELTLEQARSGYDTAITGLIGVPVLFAHAAESSNIARAYYGIAQAELLTEALWAQGLTSLEAISNSAVTATTRDRIGAANIAYHEATSRLQTLNTTSGTPLKVPALSPDFTSAQETILAADPNLPLPYSFSDYRELLDHETATHDAARSSHLMVATEATTAFTESAHQMVLIVAIATAIAVLSSYIAIWWFARRLTCGISGMARAMVTVREKLPHLAASMMDDQRDDIELPRIEVSGNDQVARLGTALNELTAEITGSMNEQATLRKSVQAMSVNIARRDQVLLGRQIALLDQLEQGQQDLETQASLYRLDHLATRMRRNAESLLVLAGIETGRRPRQPMVIQDVLQVAASEIEDYNRVDYETTDCDLKMLGHHALSAAHLVAELLENACRYSNPGTRVYVSAWTTESVVRVQVRDDGIGMNEADLQGANAKIADPVSSDYLRADKLGLYVVGQLARKLSAYVVIESQQDGGSTARVDLPLELFAQPEPAPTETAPTALTQHPEPSATPVIASVPTDASGLLSAVVDQVSASYQPSGNAPTETPEQHPTPHTAFQPTLGGTGNGLPSPRKRTSTTSKPTLVTPPAGPQNPPQASTQPSELAAPENTGTPTPETPAPTPTQLGVPQPQTTNTTTEPSLFETHLGPSPTPPATDPPQAPKPAIQNPTEDSDSVFGQNWADTELSHPETGTGQDSGFADSMRTLQEMPADELHPGARAHRERTAARTILPSANPETTTGRRHTNHNRSADRPNHSGQGSTDQGAQPAKDTGKKRSWLRMPWRQHADTTTDTDTTHTDTTDTQTTPTDPTPAPAPPAPPTAWAAAQTGSPQQTTTTPLGAPTETSANPTQLANAISPTEPATSAQLHLPQQRTLEATDAAPNTPTGATPAAHPTPAATAGPGTVGPGTADTPATSTGNPGTPHPSPVLSGPAPSLPLATATDRFQWSDPEAAAATNNSWTPHPHHQPNTPTPPTQTWAPEQTPPPAATTSTSALPQRSSTPETTPLTPQRNTQTQPSPPPTPPAIPTQRGNTPTTAHHDSAALDDTAHHIGQPSLAPPAATPDDPRRTAWTDHTQSAADALIGPHSPETAGPRRTEPPSPMEALAQERKTGTRGASVGIGDSLRQRSELASQAMAELSMLSSYSPEDDAQRQPLARRQRGATAPPPVAGPPRKPSTPRDAGKVRSTLSGFTAGAARGRKPKS